MSDDRQTDLRDLIQAVAGRSEPITLSDVVDHSPVDFPAGPFDGDGTNHNHDGAAPIIELEPGGPMTDTTNRNSYTTWLAAAAAIAVLIIGIALVIRAADNEVDIATDGDQTTTTIATTTSASTESTVEADAAAASAEEPASAPADVATEFWEAVAAADTDAAMALLAPEAVDSPGPSPWGPQGLPLTDTMRWYGIMGQQWELEGCVDVAALTAECTVTGSDSVANALGVAAITGTFRVTLTDGGVFNVADHANSFLDQYSPQAFEPFLTWTRENRPEDDYALMLEPLDGIDDETAQRFEDLLAAFVAAQEGS